ncbi:hypothetical protein SAMN05216490_1418 [Mucilaginibacter mallensis]|uniref:Beta-ketoacyl synthase, N-terminal domain n=1 Tax=Mucilaginibacter mallensis TaxID=652787 RepID=A0A1H1TDF2_MUCMA|nr:hypothetical protein [Mucilaginibacter mallensis]SDS58345.1 hypothetical protein SAMN05216490_1418 [Mucilaginibacter mallensis]
MLTEKYITASCTINKGAVSTNGVKLFENDADIVALLLSIYQHLQLNYPKFYKMDNLSKLGWLAAEVLLKDDFQKDDYQPEDTCVILANANSSLDDDIKYLESIKDVASPSLFVYTLPNIVIGEICIRNHFKGEQAFYIQDDFDADFIAQQVNYQLDNNISQACICGWVDVLEQDYKAVLFLVEKKRNGNSVEFSAENMREIFN